MEDPRAGLAEIYRDMSDDELMQRWADGHLTEIAMSVAREEFSRRGIDPPDIAPDDAGGAIGPEEAVRFVTVARSLTPTDLHILRARLESDGIPSFVVDDDITRMNSLWAIAVGGARLLVPQQFSVQAEQIVSDVKSGKFSLRDGEDMG